MVEDSGTTLLEHKQKPILNGTTPRKESGEPPDGGTKAWLVMLGSFFCNGILFGVINSYGVLYTEFHEIFKKKGSLNPSGEAALVGSLAMGTTFLISAVAGVLTDFIGLRRTTFLGGFIASSGMFLSSFCVDNKLALYVTFGVMYGLGGALAYTPSLAVLGHYFKKYLGIVNGIVTAGSSIFTIAMPYVITECLKRFKIENTLRILALIASLIMVFAFLFKPVRETERKEINWRNTFNVGVFRNKKYLVWATVIAGSLFGYFVPYVYMLDFVKTSFPGPVDGKIPVLCIGITSGIGRLIFGYIADFPKINRILLQQVAFFIIGILTMLLPSSTASFYWLIAISLGMGLFDGCFIALLGPIAFDICGNEGAAQAIGFLLGTCSMPLTIGPYVAGLIYEKQKSYTIPLILAGIPPTVGAVAMFLTRCIRTKNETLKNGTCKVTGRLVEPQQSSVQVDENKRCYKYSVL
nr:PREDICTED: monocarboxylate transporter 10 isoform X1 [Tribolium castaneum]|eukprot:XP_015840707.1 PREDICTED: monocarboxylate transporter 10 isoform X1 [Tribolium castaneum]